MDESADPRVLDLPPAEPDTSRSDGSHEHLVQFYEDEDFLLDSVAWWIGYGIGVGHGCIVVATADHRERIDARLRERRIDLAAAARRGQYIALDAEQMLDQFVREGRIDRERFHDTVGRLVNEVEKRYHRVRVFGEMVAVLCSRDDRAGALELERAWNELAARSSFSLLCGYPMSAFGGARHAPALLEICAEHSQLLAVERVAERSAPLGRTPPIVELQEKAKSPGPDVRERRAAEPALRTRERELDDFLENTVEGLRRQAADGTILWVNRAELDLLGYDAGEYVGHSMAEFHVDAEVAQSILERLRRGETLFDEPVRLRCKDGSTRHVLLHANGSWEGGRFLHARCFSRDVSDRVHLEEELRERVKQLSEQHHRKDEFLSSLAHELRNPLAPIRNALHLIHGSGQDETVLRYAAGVMERQLVHMVRLIDDLMDVARVTRNRLELRKEIADLGTIVREALDASRPLIESSELRLTVCVAERALLLEADPIRLVQVFTNLLNNAAKDCNQGGRVELWVARDRDHAVVTVIDDGAGIPPAMMSRVFDMFAQLDTGGQRTNAGLGIGLALAQRLVTLHGGTISAHSDGIGKGSRFVVRLPVLASSDVAPGEDGATPQLPVAAVSKRILVVDDSRDAAESMGLLLRRLGHEVRVAHDGLEAVSAASEFVPDVVLMDLGLPHLSGYEATRRIREESWGQRAVFIALTGWGQDADRQRTKEVGIRHHLVKPVDPAQLQKLIAEC